MPEAESLRNLAAARTTMAIHLSIHAVKGVVSELLPAYGPDCPVAIVYRASWPDERILRGTLASLAAMVADAGLERTAIILVGPALGAGDFAESALYNPEYRRRFREQSGASH
jgi:precorrin-4/cobalt-precorrin-4 C11-methyltransferase